MKKKPIEIVRRYFYANVRSGNDRKIVCSDAGQELLFIPGNEDLLLQYIPLFPLAKKRHMQLMFPEHRQALKLYIKRWEIDAKLHVCLLELHIAEVTNFYAATYQWSKEAESWLIGKGYKKVIGRCKYAFDFANEIWLTECSKIALLEAYLQHHSLHDKAQIKLIMNRNFKGIALYNEKYVWCDEAVETAKKLGINLNAEYNPAA